MTVALLFSTAISSAWAAIPAQQSSSPANVAERAVVMGGKLADKFIFCDDKIGQILLQSHSKSRTNNAFHLFLRGFSLTGKELTD
jgi:hypothetical protein